MRLLPGIGPAQARRLEARGITRLGHLQALDARRAEALLGEDGPALVRRARGEDARAVDPSRETKSVSAETTFDTDLTRREDLERHLWRLTEKLARRLREQDLAAAGVVLKLKTSGFALRTRARRLAGPTRLPDVLFAAARALLAREADGTAYRLIGIGAQPLAPGAAADQPDLAEPERAAAEGGAGRRSTRCAAGSAPPPSGAGGGCRREPPAQQCGLSSRNSASLPAITKSPKSMLRSLATPLAQ